jgi:hypothetical protein
MSGILIQLVTEINKMIIDEYLSWFKYKGYLISKPSRHKLLWKARKDGNLHFIGHSPGHIIYLIDASLRGDTLNGAIRD